MIYYHLCLNHLYRRFKLNNCETSFRGQAKRQYLHTGGTHSSGEDGERTVVCVKPSPPFSVFPKGCLVEGNTNSVKLILIKDSSWKECGEAARPSEIQAWEQTDIRDVWLLPLTVSLVIPTCMVARSRTHFAIGVNRRSWEACVLSAPCIVSSTVMPGSTPASDIGIPHFVEESVCDGSNTVRSSC